MRELVVRVFGGRGFRHAGIYSVFAALAVLATLMPGAAATPHPAAGAPVDPSGQALPQATAVHHLASTTYSVTVVPSGLPRAVIWKVYVNGNLSGRANGTGDVTVSSLVNGTYGFNFSVPGSNTYVASPAFENVTVNGTDQVLVEKFVTVYTLNFTESGLPVANRSNWHIFLDYIEQKAPAGQSIQFRRVNGSYQVTAGASLPYTAVPATATVVVNGTPPPLLISFVPPPTLYNVTFLPIGLPANSTWAVSVDGRGGGQPTGGSAFAFRETNGTHVYTASGPAGWIAIPSAATFAVAGQNLTILVDFETPPTFTVTFEPSGLGRLPWSVTIAGVGTFSGAAGGAIAVVLTNGTYAYTISGVAGLQRFPGNGAFWVTGASFVLPIAFFAVSQSVTFTELGLPGGAWWIVVNGTNYTVAAGASLSLDLPVGTYPYSTGVPNSSYVASVARGNLVVGSLPLVVSVTFLAVPSAPRAAASPTSIITDIRSHLVEVAAASAAALLVAAFLVWRRYRVIRQPPPPLTSDVRP